MGCCIQEAAALDAQACLPRVSGHRGGHGSCVRLSAVSRLQSLNVNKFGIDQIKKMLEYGLKHLTFAMELCEIQRKNGLYFVFEHPAGASSGSTSPVQRLLKHDDVKVYQGDLCCYDFKQEHEGEEVLFNKPTKFMNHGPYIGRELSLKCDGSHRHFTLISRGAPPLTTTLSETSVHIAASEFPSSSHRVIVTCRSAPFVNTHGKTFSRIPRNTTP